MMRVLAATIDAPPKPWYTRAWTAWPREWQAGSLVAAGALLAALVMLAPHADPAMTGASGAVSLGVERVWGWLQGAQVVAGFVRVMLRSVVLPIACLGFAVAMVVALASGVCWTTINRLAFDAGESR